MQVSKLLFGVLVFCWRKLLPNMNSVCMMFFLCVCIAERRLLDDCRSLRNQQSGGTPVAAGTDAVADGEAVTAAATAAVGNRGKVEVAPLSAPGDEGAPKNPGNFRGSDHDLFAQ